MHSAALATLYQSNPVGQRLPALPNRNSITKSRVQRIWRTPSLWSLLELVRKRVATFYCSFLSNLTMDLTCVGTEGYLRLHDFVIPFGERSARFYTASESRFKELSIGCEPVPSKHLVETELPQEALMVKEFARLVTGIKMGSLGIENKWMEISRKTQLVLDAVMASIKNGFEPVAVGS